MGRTPLLPPELLRGPFTLADATAAGLDRWHLEGASWKRTGPAIYVWTGLQLDPMHRIGAALQRLPTNAVFSGLTAAWLHGLEVSPPVPVDVTVPFNARVSARAGMVLRRRTLSEAEVVLVRGLRVTAVAQTLADLSHRLRLVEAVVFADMAMHLRKIRMVQLQQWVAAHRGVHGIRKLRRVLEYADPAAESPMESRLRMTLVLGGLPRPTAQVSIHDRAGRFAGRPDLYYPEQRLGIEYDGGTHRDSMPEDNRRQNNLLRSGVRLLRFTAGDVFGNPAFIVAQVREALRFAGSRGFDAA